MQTVIVPICKNKNGAIVMLGSAGLFPLQILSPSCLNTIFGPAFHHFWPQQTKSLASSRNLALTCRYRVC